MGSLRRQRQALLWVINIKTLIQLTAYMTGILPQRTKLQDFSGAAFTLNNHISAWKELSRDFDAENIILLGVASGQLEELPFVKNALKQNKKIYWLESPAALEQLKSRGLPIPPDNRSWIKIQEDGLEEAAYKARIFLYEPGVRIAPDFWGPIIGRLNIRKACACASKNRDGSLAWLPGNQTQLLHKELFEALENNGLSKIISALPDSPDYPGLEKIWDNKIPAFVLSVNFRGLDPEGRIFEICDALNIPLAIWLVDNPWHLLSGVRYPWWKRANIFVSDASFVKDLRINGARHVTHCPLAAATHMWREPARKFNKAPLFAGRSTFPRQKEFFGNIKIDSEIDADIRLKLKTYNRYPDYHWWREKFQDKPWPGKGGRKAGFYADYYSARNRARWLKKAMERGVMIIGDEGWKNIIEGCVTEGPVDYYKDLADLYHNSAAVLNVTSLLLPGSLNQRHFDVWAAGSLLLTDITEGLDIFPSELTAPIKLDGPEDFPAKFDFWLKREKLRLELILAWRESLISSHTYAHRIELIRKTVAGTQKDQIL